METFAPPASNVPNLLAAEAAAPPSGLDPERFARSLLKRRSTFGISRVGSVTRLDRIGVPVVQVVRPLALSNAVNQGKGADLHQATISGILEALETWAGENIPEDRVFTAPAAVFADDVLALYGRCRVGGHGWEHESLSWMMGWDILSRRAVPVPTALVDTRYTLPSPHPWMFPRTTTGLAAGQSFTQALIHAGLEILEKDAVVSARRRPFFFDRWGIDIASVNGSRSMPIIDRIRSAGLVCGIWQVPAGHDLPIYWCRIMEGSDDDEVAPLPSDGFGCDFTHDRALTKALTEACQARVGAIAGAREDIARRLYSSRHDRRERSEWRASLLSSGNRLGYAVESSSAFDGGGACDAVLQALATEGAGAAIVVPLYRSSDPPIEVLRLVAPGLRHGERL